MKKLATTAAFLLTLSSCASIVSDSSYPVAIDSTPSQLKFTVTNNKGVKIHSGVTPQTITLSSGAGYFKSAKYVVSFQHNDEEKSFELKSEMDGWYLGNILFGGLLGILIVDPATGAMWKLPDAQSFDLETAAEDSEGSQESAKKMNSQSLKIVSINDISFSDRAKLERIN